MCELCAAPTQVLFVSLELRRVPSKSYRQGTRSPTTPIAVSCPSVVLGVSARGSCWPDLESFCHLICKFYLQVKPQAAPAHFGPLLCSSRLVRQCAPVLLKSGAELVGIPFRHSMQMAPGCSAQELFFTHLAHSLSQAHVHQHPDGLL